jgi:ATP-binding cassette subfamily B protein
MDEATSSLDSYSEIIVKNVIDDFKSQGKTIIVIAHRLSTIANADSILVMENGTIVEEGNHHELLNKREKYYNLWHKQTML